MNARTDNGSRAKVPVWTDGPMACPDRQCHKEPSLKVQAMPKWTVRRSVAEMDSLIVYHAKLIEEPET